MLNIEKDVIFLVVIFPLLKADISISVGILEETVLSGVEILPPRMSQLAQKLC